MKIKKVVETPEGEFLFEGELSADEHDFIIEAGINFLVQQGIIPFKILSKNDNAASYVKPDMETTQ